MEPPGSRQAKNDKQHRVRFRLHLLASKECEDGSLYTLIASPYTIHNRTDRMVVRLRANATRNLVNDFEVSDEAAAHDQRRRTSQVVQVQLCA